MDDLKDYITIMESKDYHIWEPSYIYTHAKLGYPVNIGRYSEIGEAIIGDYVRIGFGCFICSGVRIGDYVFLGPRVTFCHDKHFPSGGKEWKDILVKRFARIGANSTILAGVTIGEAAIIGAGSVVLNDVPDGEIWAGNPAKRIK
jgi:UDP-2-acetamido-3-amino-2,3-dideoxy-glucuronate N-acetyltransferase